MADYFAAARSNHFKVKNASAFEAWCEEVSLTFWKDRDTGSYAICPGDDCYDGTWPSISTETDEGDLDQDHLFDALARHPVPGHIAVLVEVRLRHCHRQPRAQSRGLARRHLRQGAIRLRHRCRRHRGILNGALQCIAIGRVEITCSPRHAPEPADRMAG